MDMLRYVVGIAVKIIWNIMLSLFPAVLYYGMLSALHVLTVQCDDVYLYGYSTHTIGTHNIKASESSIDITHQGVCNKIGKVVFQCGRQ